MSSLAVHVRAVFYHHLPLEDVDPAPRDVSCALGHELDGCLELSGDPCSVFVSWQRPANPDDEFFIAVFPRNPNHAVPFTEDYSGDAMWADLVGRQVRFAYLDKTKFILQVHSDRDCVLACAYDGDRWGCNTMTVCKVPPPLGPGPMQPDLHAAT